MVTIFGNEVIDGYINGMSVKEIYNEGWLVWRDDNYYISWLPSDVSGSFTIGSSTYSLEDYSGYFSDFTGVITSSAFSGINTITSLETNAYNIGKDAFNSCKSLSHVSMSGCFNIGRNAFESCTSLLYVSLPNCVNIQGYVFSNCTHLESIDLPKCVYLGTRTFYSCYALSYVNLPECSTIWTLTFTYCSSLNTVNLPNCTSIGLQAFYGCWSLSHISLPECKYIGVQAFGFCSSLSEVNLQKCETLAPGAFVTCTHLVKVTINTPSVCEMQYDSVLAPQLAFINTPIESGEGSIYVPASLVDAYKSAQYWSTYKNNIFPIPE